MGIVKTIKSIIDYSRPTSFSGQSSTTFLNFGKTKLQKQSDKTLIEEGYTFNPEVYGIILRIANTGAQIPVVISKTNNRKREFIVDSGDLFDLIFNDTRSSYKSKMKESIINFLSSGDLFIEFLESVGFTKPSNIKINRSSCTEVLRDANGGVTGYRVQDVNSSYIVEPRLMLHIQNYDPSEEGVQSGRGMAYLQPGYLPLKASNDLNIASASLLENGSASGILTDESGQLQDKSMRSKLQAAVTKRLGGAAKFGRYVITSAKLKFIQLGLDAKQLELIKTQPMKLRQIATVLQVDSGSFNDPANTTYDSREEAEKALIMHGTLPIVDQILAEVNRYWRQFKTGESIVTDTSEIEVLQPNQKLEAEKSAIVSTGVTAVIESTITSPKQKIQILINIWKYSEENAKKLVNG